MPVYEVELSDGRVLDVEGERQPTEQEVYGLLGQSAPKPEETPEKKQLREQMELLRGERTAGNLVESALSGLSSVLEPLTPSGLLNQPARIHQALTGQQYQEPFSPGQPIVPIPKPTGTGVMAGLGRLGAQTVESLETPEGAVTLPILPASRVIQALTAAQMAADTPKAVMDAVRVFKDPNSTTADKVAAAGQPVVQATAAALLARGPAPKEVIAAAYKNPETGEVTAGAFHKEAAAEQGATAPEAKQARETPDYGFIVQDPATGKTEFKTRPETQPIAEASDQLIQEPEHVSAPGTETPLSETKVPEDVKREPVQPKAPSSIKEAFDMYDESGEIGTVQELADHIEHFVNEGTAPKYLERALRRYQRAVEEDYRMAGRGDVEPAEEKFMAAVEKASTAKPRQPKPPPPSTGEAPEQAQPLTPPEHERVQRTQTRPELQTPEAYTAGTIQKLALTPLGNLDARNPRNLQFDISDWTDSSKKEAESIADIFVFSPEGSSKLIAEFPAGTRPSEAIQSLVQAIKQGDGPGPSWLPLDQLDEIKKAFKEGRPVLAEAADQHGIKIPKGYVNQGGFYRLLDTPKPSTENEPRTGTVRLTPTQAQPPTPPAEGMGGAPFRMTFAQFLDAPREGALLEGLRQLPKELPSAESVSKKEALDAASAKLEKSGLGWVYDRTKQTEAAIRALPKTKQKLVKAYEDALTESIRRTPEERTAGQRRLYDKAVAAGLIEDPSTTAPLSESESTRLQSLTAKLESGAKLTSAEQKRFRALRDKVSPPEPEGPGIMAGPGSPSIGQSMDPQGSALRQLSDSIRTQSISPKQPIGERISEALRIGDRWAKGKDAVTQSLGRARAASSALVDAYRNLPPFEDFQRTIGRWIGADQKTSLEVRQFLKEINKAVPNRLRQEAITNWIQADGDEAVLRQRAEASKPNVRRGYELALNLNDAEKTLARNVRSYLDQRLEEGLQAGLLRQGVDNYITQIWKRPTTTTQRLWADLFGTGALNPNFKYARQRIFDSYFEGEQAGFSPKDKRVGTLIGTYDLSFNRALSARAMIKQLHEAKAADGLPVVMTSGKTSPVPAGEAPPEAYLIKPNQVPKDAVTADGRPYRPIDHWALRDWKWATKGPEGQNVFVQGDMLVHPDHWQHLNNVLKTSRLQQNPVTRFLLQSGSLAKQTKLSLSPFHLTQEAVHAMAHRVNPANTVELNLDDPIQRSLVDRGLMVQDPRAQELFSEGMTGGGLVTKIPGLGHLQAKFNDILFKDYIPRLKMSMALDALERNRKAYSGKVSDDQILALTAREANAAFGEQNYRMMGRSPTVQDFFRLSLLAPDFLEARARFLGQALKPYGREQRIALGLMAATLYVGGRVLNQWLDDDPHWNKPFSVQYKGREYRLRTLLGDVQHLVTDPRSFWYNRFSPWVRASTEYWTGRDDRGIKRSSMEQLADFASWFRPIPTQARSDQTLAQSALQSAGVSSRTYGAQQQLYEILDRWRANQTDPKIREAYDQYRKETHADSVYAPLRRALAKGDDKAAAQAYRTLRTTHTAARVIQAMRQDRPFAGSARAEGMFLKSLTPDQKALYVRAKAERKALYDKFIALKLRIDRSQPASVYATP